MGEAAPPRGMAGNFCYRTTWTEDALAADPANPSASAMRSLERALGVMKVLEQSRRPLRLSEIARRADLHVATTQRILRVLERFGYVGQEVTGYTTGITSLLNAHAFLTSNGLVIAARPVLQELADACGLTATLSVQVGLSKVVIGRVEGASPLRYQLPVGGRMPLHLGSGRIFAASMEPAQVAELLEEVGEIRLATGRVLTPGEFVTQLGAIRNHGYAVTFSERVLGAASVGVPIVDRAGRVIASVQLSGLVEDVDTSRLDWYVSELKRAAAAIAERTG